jgi:hypothetical protein
MRHAAPARGGLPANRPNRRWSARNLDGNIPARLGEDVTLSRNSRTSQGIFELLRSYHQSRENIRLLIDMSPMTDYERVGFIDAWQEEMADLFAENGYCFACNKRLERCTCDEPLRPAASA